MVPAKPYSLRRRLLVWLLVPLVIIGLIALADTYREAVNTANTVSDRVLAGSALAIAERIVVAENGVLEVDVPYVALEMLTSAAQDRVFYRVDGPGGVFITGYQTLPVIKGLAREESGYADASFRGEPIRLTSLSRAASTGASSIPFVVTIAETTIARTQLARTILLRSALRLAILIGSAAAIMWLAVTFSLRPLYRLRDAIAERSPDDLHPIEQSVPKEVRGLVDTVNSFMGDLARRLGGCGISPAMPATSCARRWPSSAHSWRFRRAPVRLKRLAMPPGSAMRRSPTQNASSPSCCCLPRSTKRCRTG